MAENIDMIQSDSSDSAVDSAKGESELLSKLLERESIAKNNDGQFLPSNKQLKDLVNCIDDSTGKLISLERINTSKITSMKELFANSNRTDFSGIEEWDTSNVTSFAYAFSRAEHFDSDISQWNVSKGKSFYYMFFRALKFNQPIGESWDTSNAVNMRAMFCFAINFNNGGKAFGDKWKMDKVEISAEMFYNAKNFNAEGLNKWNMSNIRKCWSMFNGAESFNQDLSAWGDKLSKTQTMWGMFINTKALSIDFLGAWKIPQNCNADNIIKGSKLESREKSDIKVIVASDSVKENIFNKCEINQIYKIEKAKIQNLRLNENKEFVGEWIPQNILENDYKVFLAKIKDKNKDDEVLDEEKISFDDLEQGSCNKWDFAFYKVFDCWFLVEKDGKELSDIKKCEGTTFEIEQSTDIDSIAWDESDKTKAESYDNNLSILFSSKYISILASNVAKPNDILAVLNAYILAKSYNAKMQELGNTARMANEQRRKNKENEGLLSWIPFSKTKRTNKKLYKDLKKSYEFVCNFDLHSYHNIPISQNKLDDTSLIKIWLEMSKTYMIQNRHDELKETIKQVTQLVSDERQEDLNFIMRWVAWLSAIAALLAAYPVIKDIWLWIASKF